MSGVLTKGERRDKNAILLTESQVIQLREKKILNWPDKKEV